MYATVYPCVSRYTLVYPCGGEVGDAEDELRPDRREAEIVREVEGEKNHL